MEIVVVPCGSLECFILRNDYACIKTKAYDKSVLWSWFYLALLWLGLDLRPDSARLGLGIEEAKLWYSSNCGKHGAFSAKRRDGSKLITRQHDTMEGIQQI